jgi:CubicO group peptidase (beta-lactamase class C family)
MKRTFLGTLALLVWAASTVAPAQTTTSPSPTLDDDAAIRRLLIERIDGGRGVGMVVGVITPAGRRTIAHGRFGVGDARPVDGSTIFEIGSITKVFTSLLLADMVRRGEVALADPVARHLPSDLPLKPNAARMTLADLATHTAGLPFWPSNVPATGDTTGALAAYSVDDLYRFAATFEAPADAPRRWQYSNTDNGLLGALLARRAGSSYESAIATRITGPLGMTSTSVTVPAAAERLLASGHDAQLKPAARWNVPALAGAGSLHSTANDLSMFLAALSDERSSVAAALPTMLATRHEGPGFVQTVGWWIVSTGPDDPAILAHDGQTLGFASAIAYDPRTHSGVVVLSNSAASVGDIARHLLRPAIPLSKLQAPAPPRTEIAIDAALLDRYVGRYEPGPGAVFVVTREGDVLMLQLPGLPKLRLRPESPRSFFVPENTRVTVTFEVDSAGRAVRLTLGSPTGDVPARRLDDR